jgi:hypothetical protein
MFNLCLPSILYFSINLIVTLLSYVYFNRIVITEVLMDTVTLIFFTWLLNYFCTKNYKFISWIIFIIFMIINFSIIFIIRYYNIRTYDDMQKFVQ